MILLFTDFYKVHHHRMYPEQTNLMYDNLTPRKSRIPGITGVVSYFFRPVLKSIVDAFGDFFNTPWEQLEAVYKKHIPVENIEHIRKLWLLGYLPLEIKVLPEGTICPIGVPVATIRSTHKDAYWLPNYLETLLSVELWKPMTAATIAHAYKKKLTAWAIKTGGDPAFVNWQGHDFSMRGMSNKEDAMSCGSAHLLSFTGTDTIPAIYWAEAVYDAEGLIGGSVPATEHSVMCMGLKEGEDATFDRLMKLYPDGILSVVSDTWDLWKVVSTYLPDLKDHIMKRDGKLVIRPDSGDPADILCGRSDLHKDTQGWYDKGGKAVSEAERKGLIELLWETFGGTTNEKGYKQLDSHIGAIYGDSITLDRAEEICSRLAAKGFASTNVVLGIGSYTYQYVTRDTLGFAIKATYGEVNGEGREIYKDPITDDGTKRSKKGLLKVYEENGVLKVKDQCTWKEEKEGLLETVLLDGKILVEPTFQEIRDRLQAEVEKEVGLEISGIAA